MNFCLHALRQTSSCGTYLALRVSPFYNHAPSLLNSREKRGRVVIIVAAGCLSLAGLDAPNVVPFLIGPNIIQGEFFRPDYQSSPFFFSSFSPSQVYERPALADAWEGFLFHACLRIPLAFGQNNQRGARWKENCAGFGRCLDDEIQRERFTPGCHRIHASCRSATVDKGRSKKGLCQKSIV